MTAKRSIFVRVVMVLACNPRSGRRERYLSADNVKFHGLHKGSAVVGILLQFEREEVLVLRAVNTGHRAVNSLTVTNIAQIELELKVLKYMSRVILFPLVREMA